MAKWQFTLELGDFYHDYDPNGEDGITITELSQKVSDKIEELVIEIRSKSERLGKLKVKHITAFAEILSDMADELESDVLPMFEELVEVESEDIDDFDNAMSYLYDWADTKLDNEWAGKSMCWVNTFKKGE